MSVGKPGGASWPAIVAMVDAEFHITLRGEDWVGLRHPATVKVKVQLTTELGRSWVRITSDVMAAHAIPAMTARMIKHGVSVGALQIEDDRVLLQHRIAVEGLHVIELRRVIHDLGTGAQHLRPQITAIETHPVDYYGG